MGMVHRREVVVEYERREIVRRKARTIYAYCSGCGTLSDLIGIAAAAELFQITVEQLLAFAADKKCHIAAAADGAGTICLNDLTSQLKAERSNRFTKRAGREAGQLSEEK